MRKITCDWEASAFPPLALTGPALLLRILGGGEAFGPSIAAYLVFADLKPIWMVCKTRKTSGSLFRAPCQLSGLVDTDELRIVFLPGKFVRVPENEDALHFCRTGK